MIHENTFGYVRKRNHKCFKLESDKGRRSQKASRALGKGHFHFGLGQFLIFIGCRFNKIQIDGFTL